MDQIGKNIGLILLLFTAILLGSCGNWYLDSPFFYGGDVELFLDGKLVACTNLAHPYEADMGEFLPYVDSGSNPVNSLDEVLVYQRGIALDEIGYLYQNPGLVSDADRLTGYYDFNSSNLDCNGSVGQAALRAGSLISGAPPSYPLVSSTNALEPAADSLIALGNLGAPPLPGTLESLTISFWFQEELGNEDRVGLITLEDRSDGNQPPVDLFIEPGGILALEMDGVKIIYIMKDAIDETNSHLVTLRLWNR
ncbi:MAG: hypothetical protein JXA95_13095 [Spirochaetales bacterium]|nr:hypothetical protein [Spirochaetales bacterium]